MLFRSVLAGALARGEARHAAVVRNQQPVNEVREAWRRSGGRTAKLGQAELSTWYLGQLAGVTSLQEFRALPLRVDADEFVPRAVRDALAQLPGAMEIRGRASPLHYEVEETPEGNVGVVRVVLHEKQARGLVAEEITALDRPLRYTVTRGARGSVKAATLDDMHDALTRPFTDDETARAFESRRSPGQPWGADARRPGGGRPGGDRRQGRDDRDRGGSEGGRDGGHGGPRGPKKGGTRPGSPAGKGKRRGR